MHLTLYREILFFEYLKIDQNYAFGDPGTRWKFEPLLGNPTYVSCIVSRTYPTLMP